MVKNIFLNQLNTSKKFVVPYYTFNERFKKNEAYINSKIERHIALWCINNNNLFNHPDCDK